MKRALLPALLAASVAAACGDEITPTSAADPTSAGAASNQAPLQEVAAPRDELVLTPSGWYHRSCVHEVPNGARVSRAKVVTRVDGTSYDLPKCLHPGRRTAEGARTQSPVNNGWIEDARDNLGQGHAYGGETAEWTVPDAPLGSYSGTQVYYTFPGLWSDEYIIQPVLQYGYNGAFGGSYWRAASWHCDDGYDCTYSTPISVSAGHAMLGTVTSSDCAEGECSWTIIARDLTAQSQSTYVVTDTWDYPNATGGAVEVWGLTTCSQYPRNGVFYTGIALHDENGQGVTPSWWERVTAGLDPTCDFDVSSTASTADLYHNPPLLDVEIDGPTYITSSGTYTWDADVSGGIGNYQYEWSYRTNHVDGFCSYVTPWVSAGSASSMQTTVTVPGYRMQIRLIVTSGDQEVDELIFVALSQYRQCPEKATGGQTP